MLIYFEVGSKEHRMSTRKMRAFVSVTDKSNLVEFRRWANLGHEIVSTGGTAKALGALNIPCTMVEEVTGFPEILGGRVKSMHPKITGGMLGNMSDPDHHRQMLEHSIKPFDLVVVNLYDFNGNPCIENIDVGGPTALRSAAKNAANVVVLTDPLSYAETIDKLLSDGDLEIGIRVALAVIAFGLTARYDYDISVWLGKQALQGLNPFQRREGGH